MPHRHLSVLLIALSSALPAAELPEAAFFKNHCFECHDADVHKAGLDLTAVPWEPQNPDNQALWVKIHDRVHDGEMPPAKKKERPEPAAVAKLTGNLAKRLIAADLAGQKAHGRTPMRRLSRVEFEWSVRDLLALPALPLKDSLPEDGRSHGFDRLAHALDFSSIHLEAYLAAVDKALDAALCPLTERPTHPSASLPLWRVWSHRR